MTITGSTQILNEGLRSHLDQLAQSCSYYYGKLCALEVPKDLAEDLVVDWHKGKVQSWVDQQNRTNEPTPSANTGRHGRQQIG